MLEFTESEKVLLKRIYQGWKGNRISGALNADILAKEFEKIANKYEGKIDLSGVGEVVINGWNPDKLIRFSTEVQELALLIKTLIDDRLLYCYPCLSKSGPSSFVYSSPKFTVVQQASVQIDKGLASVIQNTSQHFLLFSPTLKSYMESEMKSYEEQSLDEARKQTKSARVSVIVSVVAVCLSLITILISIIDKC